MPRIQVRLFARFRDVAERELLELDLPGTSDVGAIRDALRERFEVLSPLLDRSRISVNNDFADDSWIVSAGDEIALIPPVSGG